MKKIHFGLLSYGATGGSRANRRGWRGGSGGRRGRCHSRKAGGTRQLKQLHALGLVLDLHGVLLPQGDQLARQQTSQL